MGLDVYLYRYENREETEQLEKQHSEFSEANWEKHGDYDKLTDSQKKIIRREDEDYAIKLGLNKNGEDPRKTEIEIDSAKYPDHYFKIGYFRSSYNDGGINSILRNLGVADLYEIFNPNDQYVFAPDWELALIKTKEVLSVLREKPNLRCFDISWNDFKNPLECDIRDEKKALEVYLSEKAREGMDCYLSGNGHFYHKEPIKVYGLVQGVKKMILSDVVLPAVFVITEGQNEWYIQALEIVEETLNYVLSQPDKDKYFLHWSS